MSTYICSKANRDGPSWNVLEGQGDIVEWGKREIEAGRILSISSMDNERHIAEPK